MRSISRRLFVIAALFGILGALLTTAYLRQERQRLVETSTVVVARQDIPARTHITAAMVVEEAVPTGTVHPLARAKAGQVVGTFATADLFRGEQVLASRLATGDLPNDMAYRVPAERRAMSLRVDAVSGVSGYVAPGDRVDVVVSFDAGPSADAAVTRTVLTNIEVLAVGEQDVDIPVSDRTVNNGKGTITLALTPQEAQVLAFADTQGKVRLTLRPAAGGEDAAPAPTTMQTLR